MTPRLRTTGRPPLPMPPLLWPLLCLALLSGPALTGTHAYAAEPSPPHAPASADDEARAGSRPSEGRTPPGRAESGPPGRAESGPPGHSSPKATPSTHLPRHEPSAARSSAPDTAKPSASVSPRKPSKSQAHPKASSAAPSRKGHSAPKSHFTPTPTPASASAPAAVKTPKRSRAPSAAPSRTRSAQVAIPVVPEEPPGWEEDPEEQQVQPSVRPTSAPVDNADRTPRQTGAEPVIPGVGVLPLGSGLVLVGLGVGFLALRLRRP
ncbi:hypothetical protein ACFC4G_12380 [Streptomyces sp. NPDC056002]|uniref:hypothetical protein n=1 Tax=Streptomyces sp. NPDC056002 TaxID=3345675 RepID=UPI0035D632C6